MTCWIPLRWLPRISNPVSRQARKAMNTILPVLPWIAPNALSMSKTSVGITGATLDVYCDHIDDAWVKKLSSRDLLIKGFAVISLLMFSAKITLMMGPAIQSLGNSNYNSKSAE